MSDDAYFLRRAIALAETSITTGAGGPFGAVIVCCGVIVGEGRNQVVPDRDPTAHAEVMAIRDACRRLDKFHLADCTLYASSEPCPMCLSAAYWAKITRIVFANPRAEAAAVGFCDDELYSELRLPHGERKIVTDQLEIPDANAPLRHWHENPSRESY